MHEIVCIDETFDPNFTSEYKLSIQVGLDGFSFSILDDIRKKFLVFQHFSLRFKNYNSLTRKVEDIIQKNELLKHSYKKVTIIFVTQYCTLIPQQFNKTNKPESLFYLNFENPGNNCLEFSELEKYGVSLLFSIPEKLKTFFQSTYFGCKIIHQSEIFLKKALLKSNEKVIQVSLTVNRRFINLLILSGTQILFFNSFNYQNESDIIYFILLSLKTTGINSMDVVLHLNGAIEKESVIYQLLTKYFNSINFVTLNQQYHYSYTFSAIQEHQFFSVINSEG